MAIYAGPAIYFRGPSLVKIDSPKPIEIRLFAASCGALHFSCPVKPTRKNKWDKRVGDKEQKVWPNIDDGFDSAWK